MGLNHARSYAVNCLANSTADTYRLNSPLKIFNIIVMALIWTIFILLSEEKLGYLLSAAPLGISCIPIYSVLVVSNNTGPFLRTYVENGGNITS